MSQKLRILALSPMLAIGGLLASCSPDRSMSVPEDAAATLTTLPTVPPDDTNSAGSALVACDLLQIADIEATGLTVVDAPGTDPNTPGDECRFGLPKALNSVIGGAIEVELIPAETGQLFQPTGSPDEVSIADVGIQAWGSQGSALARLADGRVVVLSVAGLGLVDPWPFVVELLVIAVDNAGPVG